MAQIEIPIAVPAQRRATTSRRTKRSRQTKSAGSGAGVVKTLSGRGVSG